MKKIITASFFISFLLFSTTYAQIGAEMMGANYENILQEIYATQNVKDSKDLNCSQITNDQFEELGDAVMESIHPGEAHEYMDRMMGGEGSESLRQAHINMGRSFLGCWSGYDSGPFMMMGGYQIMPGMFGNWGGYGTGNMIFITLWLILSVIGAVAVIKWIINISNKQK